MRFVMAILALSGLVAVLFWAGQVMSEGVDLSRPLPDGGEARTAAGDIRGARYMGPTRRYAHAVLGDAIEAAALEVRFADGRKESFVLPQNEVFEDITPRIADLDRDGLNEVITIVASQSGGGSLAVFGMVDGALARRANSPSIGIPNRWMNAAGIADFDGDGVLEIAVVRTPHIGGTLEIWQADFARQVLDREASLHGFSNHAIGSRALDLSVVTDIDGDGVSDLIVPDASRRALRFVKVTDAGITEVKRVSLAGRVDGNLVIEQRGGQTVVVVPLTSGERETVPIYAN